MARIGIFSGSFDPVTNGHIWVMEEGCRLFDQLHIPIGNHPHKDYLFTEEERQEMVRESIKNPKIVFGSLGERNVIHYAEQFPNDDVVILRGIRDASDFEYENQLYEYIRARCNLPAVFVMPPVEKIAVSSTLVKGYCLQERWSVIEKLVPPAVLAKLKEKYAGKSLVPKIYGGVSATKSTPTLWETDYFEDENLDKMRRFFDHLVKYKFINCAQTITASQVRTILDPVPFDVVSSKLYHLKEIPIDYAKPYGGRFVPCSRSVGPIVVDINLLTDHPLYKDTGPVAIIEGKHRWLDAKEQGRETILAWVGENVLWSLLD